MSIKHFSSKTELFTALVFAVFIITAFASAYQGMMQAVEEGIKKYGNSYRLIPKDSQGPITYQGIQILPSCDVKTLSFSEFAFLKENHNSSIGISPRVVKNAYLYKDMQQLVW